MTQDKKPKNNILYEFECGCINTDYCLRGPSGERGFGKKCSYHLSNLIRVYKQCVDCGEIMNLSKYAVHTLRCPSCAASIRDVRVEEYRERRRKKELDGGKATKYLTNVLVEMCGMYPKEAAGLIRRVTSEKKYFSQGEV